MYSSIFITISIIFDNILEAQVGGHVAVVSFNLLYLAAAGMSSWRAARDDRGRTKSLR